MTTNTTTPADTRRLDTTYDSILQAVGWTPMIRLDRIAPQLPVEFLGKCEFMNPGGSVKDRIGVRMLLDAEREGRIKPGDTLIEPTSGNTGIGLAMAAAVRGYRMVITMPEKMSHEKQVVLEALGAEIIRTPTEAAWDSPESHIGVAERLAKILPNAHILDQYKNPGNPLAHEEGTGVEILAQTGGKLDVAVIGAGTGGTITGVARALKNYSKDIQVVGVDPVGSILAGPEPIQSYKVEGIGYDFIPDVLDRSLVDRWVKTEDRESFLVARELIRKEGVLVGGSSGSAMWAAMEIAKDLPKGARVVVILPDSIRNYLTKFVDDAWMRRNGFSQPTWEMGSIGDLLRAMGPREVVTAKVDDHLADVVACFKEHGFSQLPVVDDGRVVGILTETDVLGHLVANPGDGQRTVAEVMVRNVFTVLPHTPASELPRAFDRGEVALVVDDDNRPVGILTKMDLIDILASGKLTSVPQA